MFDVEQFRNPSGQYRIHPFWFWNGELAEEEISRQYDEMVEKGIGGVFICARQGMTVPYLSQAWFDKVRFGVEEAKKRNMDVWLYDEYPYPSGIAGGEVTLRHPDAKHYTLEPTTKRVEGGEELSLELPWARVLYAKAVPVLPDGSRDWSQAIDVSGHIGNYQSEQVFQKAGLTSYNEKRYFSYRPVQKIVWTAPSGSWEIVVVQEKELEDFKYYQTYVDPCNREAMETFIRLTHDKYAEHLGEYFGNTIKGMFTDETGFLGDIPWSPQIPEYFLNKYGYDLRDHLHALLFSEAQDTARIRYDYFQAAHELLLENYHKLMHDWCEKHGLEYVAEVPSMRMTTQLYGHMTGGDSAHEKLGRSLEWILNKYTATMRGNPKMVSSLMRQLNRERNLIECFHSLGWSMTLQDAKWMIDRMAAQGTNFFNFHAFFYTLDGLMKHDAPPSQFLQNPYWKYFRELGDYTGRISYLMSVGEADAPIAVIFPVTTLWNQMGNPLHSFGYGGSEAEEKERLERLKTDWVEICNRLTFTRRDYDHLDPELMDRAVVGNGTITIGRATYSVLILPPMTNLEEKAWRKIREFAQSGGKVISMGLLPYEIIDTPESIEPEAREMFGLSESVTDSYWKQREAPASSTSIQGEGNAYFIPISGGEVQSSLQELSELLERLAPAAVTLQTGQPSHSFLLQTRTVSDDSLIVFLSNQEEGEHRAAVEIDLNRLKQNGGAWAGGRPVCRELCLETGELKSIDAESAADGIWSVPLHIFPYESRALLITLSEEQNGGKTSQPEPAAVLEVPVSGVWELEPDRGNTVRFDTFAMSFYKKGDDPKQSGALEGGGAKVQVKTFIDQCSDIADATRFPLAMSQQFGTPYKTKLYYPLQSAYSVRFEVEHIPDSCRLIMDSGAISGAEWVIRINGNAVTSKDFSPYFLYDYLNVAADIGSYLIAGVNEIKVEIEITRDWDGLIDALYLQGPFSVGFGSESRPVLSKPVLTTDKLDGQWVEGYPYYAGTLTYSRTLPVASLPAGKTFELAFDGWDPNFHDCAEISVNGQTLGVRAWSPYRWFGDIALLREGDNRIEVRVTNTLIGLMEGKYFDYAGHTLKPVASGK